MPAALEKQFKQFSQGLTFEGKGVMRRRVVISLKAEGNGDWFGPERGKRRDGKREKDEYYA